MRYTIKISFITQMFEQANVLIEKIKSMQQAQTYKALVDETVNSAVLIDNISGEVVEVWK